MALLFVVVISIVVATSMIFICTKNPTDEFIPDMTGMVVEIFKSNTYKKLPIWVLHRYILTPKSYQRIARKQVIATCNRQRCSVCSVILMRTNCQSKSWDQRTKKKSKSYRDLSDTLSVTKIRKFNL